MMRKRHFVISGASASADQWASFMMIGALLAALLAVNTSVKSVYDLVHHTSVAIRFGEFIAEKPLVVWINEGLMAFFFLAVSLELKREILEGHLSRFSQMMLPAFAALGGMIVPVAIYLVINRNHPEFIEGWAIPSATDIALSLGVLSLLGKRVPIELKLFLAALAIFDDLGGILIIAFFYGTHVTLGVLAVALLAIIALFILNYFAVTHISLYFVIGLILWATFQESGIHPTMAGVAVGLALPLRVTKPCAYNPLRFVEDGLHPWVAFLIVPLFTFFNAGIALTNISVQHIGSPLTLGIVGGLVIGKPLGIFTFAFLAQRFGFASLADSINWRQIFGVALLGGIGFTMGLFLNALAFPYNGAPEFSKLAILIGSVLSGSAGLVWLNKYLPHPPKIMT